MAPVPAGPVLDFEGMFDHPQVRHRGMQIAPDETSGRHLPHVANPIRFSASPIEAYRDAPTIGADTESVLSALLGLKDEDIARLRAAKSI